MSEGVVVDDPRAVEAALVGRIAGLERGKSAAAAEQAELTVELDTMRRAREAQAGVAAAVRGRGLGGEIGLARHDSAKQGRHHLAVAKVLVADMPHTLAAVKAGALSEWRAGLIVAEAAGLTAFDRRTVDAELCAEQTHLTGLGNKRITTTARSIAYRLDSQAAADRARRAPADRGVSIRPAPEGMSYLTAFLPLTHGMAVHGALKAAADANRDGRPRGHVMADTLIERVTGRPADVAVPVAVNLVLTDKTLLAGDPTPARIPGYGPIPAAIARHLIGAAACDDRSKATLRRLYQHPSSGALVAMESRARLFPKGLARFIDLRDDTCRTPYCDAPIRHHDHAQPKARGGKTSALNSLGECEACNYMKEAPGWQVCTHTADHGTHTADFTTPTGAQHRSNAPPLVGDIATITPSGIERQLGIDLTRYAA